MNLQKASRFFYDHPKTLFNFFLLFSLILHVVMLTQLPLHKSRSITTQKDEVALTSISMDNVSLKSSVEMPQKEPEVKEEEKEIEENAVPEETIPLPSVSEVKKGEAKEEIIKRGVMQAPPIPEDVIKKAIMNYKKEIQKRINAVKSYPLYARRTNQEGVIRVEFILRMDGVLKGDVSIINRCRYKVLNDEALKTIMKANPYPPFPSELKRDELIFTVDLDFNLEN